MRATNLGGKLTQLFLDIAAVANNILEYRMASYSTGILILRNIQTLVRHGGEKPHYDRIQLTSVL